MGRQEVRTPAPPPKGKREWDIGKADNPQAQLEATERCGREPPCKP